MDFCARAIASLGCFDCNPCKACEDGREQSGKGAAGKVAGFALDRKRGRRGDECDVEADDMLEINSTLSSSAVLGTPLPYTPQTSTAQPSPTTPGGPPSTSTAAAVAGGSDSSRMRTDTIATVSAITSRHRPEEPPPPPWPRLSWLEEERAAHAAMTAAHRRLYVPAHVNLAALSAYADDGGPEILALTGPDGSGKTALAANWSESWRQEHPDDAVILHLAGAAGEAGAGVAGLVRRVVAEVLELDPRLKAPERGADEADSLLRFAEWLAACASALPRRLVLVVDGADELACDLPEQAQPLPWLPYAAAPRLRLVVSCLEGGDALEAAQGLPHALARVAPLDAERRRAVAAGRLRARPRTPLAEAQLQRLLAAEQASSPLFLRLALEQLQEAQADVMRQVDGAGWARGGRLPEPPDALLACPDAAALLRLTLERWEARYGAAVVCPALAAVACSRCGMREAELAALLGVGGGSPFPGGPAPSSPVPPRLWSDFRSAALASGVLFDCQGLLRFFHRAAREAAEARLGLADAAVRRRWHAWLGAFFAAQAPSPRRADECPWQLERAGEPAALLEALSEVGPLRRLGREETAEELARLWLATGRPAEAVPRIRAALERYEAGPGCDAGQLADDLAAAGLLLRLLGECEAALPMIERSVAMREAAAWGEGGRSGLAAALAKLADARLQRGEHGEALTLYRRALELREASEGAGSAAVADLLRRIAECLDKQGQYADAEATLTRALRVAEATHGAGSAAAARVLRALAGVTQEQGLFNEAADLLHRCQWITESIFGPDHPETAAVLNDGATLDALRGEFAEAEAACRRALEIRERAHGGDHPAVALSLRNLALLLQMVGRAGEAEPHFLRAIKIEERALGVDHPSLAQTLSGLGLLYQAQERFDRAEYLFKRSLALIERRLGPSHRDVARELDNLAGLYVAMGRPDEAEPLYERSIAVREAVHGRGHWTVADALRAMARVREAQGRHEEADQLYAQALEGLEAALPPGHPLASACVAQAANFYRKIGRLPEAEAMYRRAVAMRSANRGQHDEQLVSALCALSSLCEEQDRLAEAAGLLRSAAAAAQAWGGRGGLRAAGLQLQLADFVSRHHGEVEAIEQLEEASRLLEGDTSDDARVLALAVSSRLRQAYLAAGREEEAEAMGRRAAPGGPHAALSQQLLMLQSMHRE